MKQPLFWWSQYRSKKDLGNQGGKQNMKLPEHSRKIEIKMSGLAGRSNKKYAKYLCKDMHDVRKATSLELT
jgi:hypothetical protein